MSQQRPPIPQSSSSTSILSPFTLLQSTDSYFRDLRARTSRSKVSERASDIGIPLSTTPSLSRTPLARPLPTTTASDTSAEFFSKANTSATEGLRDTPDQSPSIARDSTTSDLVNLQTVGDPPRPPKLGYEWVWYPDPYGYWAERPEVPRSVASATRIWPIWKKISFTSKGSTASFDKLPFRTEAEQSDAERKLSNAESKANSERRSSLRLLLRRSSRESNRESDVALNEALASSVQESLQQKLVKGFSLLSPKIGASPTTENTGFFNRKGKRKIVVQKVSPGSGSEYSTSSRTATLLKGVAEFFEHGERHSSDPGKSQVPPSQFQHRKGIYGRERRTSQDSGFSLTDSIRDFFMGKTPVVTPIPQPKYLAADGRTYSKVELGTKDAPTFLPSEATRINTPPLSDEAIGSPSRSFFMNLSPPGDNDKSISIEGTSSVKNVASHYQSKKLVNSPPSRMPTVSESPSTPGSRNRIAKLRHMWENGIQTEAKQEIKRPKFELDVPEHLPSSPLCPINPKHKSGGTGVCVYHGRNRKHADS